MTGVCRISQRNIKVTNPRLKLSFAEFIGTPFQKGAWVYVDDIGFDIIKQYEIAEIKKALFRVFRDAGSVRVLRSHSPLAAVFRFRDDYNIFLNRITQVLR